MFKVLKVFKVTLKNFFRKTFTIMYPDKQKEIPDRYRGPLFALTVDKDGNLKCIACRLCEQICPSQIITVVPAKEKGPTGKPYPEKFTLMLDACLACELCVQVCPADAIVMLKVPGWAAESHDEMFLTLEKMVEYGKKYEISASTASVLRKMQTPPRRTAAPAAKKEG